MLRVLIYPAPSRSFVGTVMDDARREQYEKQTEEIYTATGRFTVKFEHVCEAMNTGIVAMLDFAGLRNQRIAQAVLAGLTAAPLRTMFAAVLAESCKDRLDDSEQKIISNVLSRVTKLIESRNDIIHRTYK
jgi:phosphopantetheinyl transferase (holo-ACP synthase)